MVDPLRNHNPLEPSSAGRPPSFAVRVMPQVSYAEMARLDNMVRSKTMDLSAKSLDMFDIHHWFSGKRDVVPLRLTAVFEPHPAD